MSAHLLMLIGIVGALYGAGPEGIQPVVNPAKVGLMLSALGVEVVKPTIDDKHFIARNDSLHRVGEFKFIRHWWRECSEPIGQNSCARTLNTFEELEASRIISDNLKIECPVQFERWTTARIFYLDVEVGWRGCLERQHINGIDSNPWSLIRFHQVQLPLHGDNLPSGSFSLFEGGLGNGMSGVVSTMQGAPLGIADANGYKSKKRYDPSRVSSTTSRTIWGAFLLSFGAVFLKCSFYIGDVPDNPMIFRIVSWTLGVAAFVLILQGGILILTGERLTAVLAVIVAELKLGDIGANS
jgi:hypothetical protein